MQSLSFFDSKGACLAPTNLNSASKSSSVILRRRRRKRWGLCNPFGGSSRSKKFYIPIDSGGIRCQNRILGHEVLSSGLNVNIYGPKKGALGRSRSVAMALALEQEPIGRLSKEEVSDSEEPESKRVSLNTSNGAENTITTEFREDEQEQTDQSIGDEFAEKGKIDVRALASSLNGAKTADDVEQVLKNTDDLPLPVYSTMIRAFGFEKKLDPAFALVNWLKRKNSDSNGSFGPNLYIFNSLLGAIKQTKQYEKIDEVIDDMKSHGIVPNIVTYNTLISVYLEQGKPEEALLVLDDIKKNGLTPSPVTYSTILLVYREMQNASGAIDFFVHLRETYEKGEMEQGKDYDWDAEIVKLETFTIHICYIVMRHFLVKEDDPSIKVLKVLTDMDKARLKLGRQEYEKLIWACTNESRYNVARELYKRIRETESEISLSVCNHVIWLMGKAKKWWAALEVYEELLDKGPKPNNLSYELILSHFNILLTAAKKKGIWRWGVRLINKMLEKGLRPGTREWDAVLVACSKASETSAAVQIFRRMVDQGEKPTVVSYGALLSALEKGKLYDEALQVWEHMCKVGLKPNLHSYTILASVYIGKGTPEMVDSVIREMDEARIEPSVVTFNAIITGCAKSQMGGAAFEWFHRMKVRNIKPNGITYDMLIEALANDGKPKLAYEMYLKARNEGLHPSSRAYDAVVESCQDFDASLNMNALGPRPVELRKRLKIRKNLSEFCKLADVPRRSKPFDNTEIYTS